MHAKNLRLAGGRRPRGAASRAGPAAQSFEPLSVLSSSEQVGRRERLGGGKCEVLVTWGHV